MNQGRMVKDTNNLDEDEDLNELATWLENCINHLETKINGLIAKNNERAIRFSGLKFQSMKESNPWLEMELSRHHSGCWVGGGRAHGLRTRLPCRQWD
jgi:hypothetical protein